MPLKKKKEKPDTVIKAQTQPPCEWKPLRKKKKSAYPRNKSRWKRENKNLKIRDEEGSWMRVRLHSVIDFVGIYRGGRSVIDYKVW